MTMVDESPLLSSISEDDIEACHTKDDKFINDRTVKAKPAIPFVYHIFMSEFYRSSIKVFQYMACVSLSLTLYGQEFFQHKIISVDEIIYGTTVLAPLLLFYVPTNCAFFVRLYCEGEGNIVFWAIWNYHRRSLILETLASTITVLVAVASICGWIFEFGTSGWGQLDAFVVAAHTYFVCLYLITFSSWSHLKRSILQSRDQAYAEICNNEESIFFHKWADIIGKVQEEKNEQFSQWKGISIWWHLTVKFPVASFLAWTGCIVYTTMQPLQSKFFGELSYRLSNVPPDTSFWYLFEFGLYMLLTFVAQGIFLWMMKWGFARFSAKVEEYLRFQMNKIICTAPKSLAANLEKGDLSSRYSREIAMISNFIDKNKLFTSFFFLLTSIITLYTVDWRLGYFFTFTVPVLVITLAEKPGKAHKSATVAAGNLQSRFENVVELRRIMYIFGTGEFVYEKTSRSMQDNMVAIYESKYAGANYISSVHGTGVAYIALMALSIMLAVIPKAQAGQGDAARDIIAALSILISLKSPFSQIGQGVEHWLSTSPSLVRVYECCKDDESREKKANGGIDRLQGDSPSLSLNNAMSFSDVRFRYAGDGPDVLKGVNTELHLGEYTCIVGGSGAGKSTLLNIITREVIETDGCIKLDGVKLERNIHSNIDSYREKIGIVPQHSIFLNGTIADNIRVGKPTATEEEIVRAARLAQCTFLDDLPDGIQTTVGGETTLSGGQGQRVCLARALVRNPKLLILDEATSALDPKTEEDAVRIFVDLAKKGGVAVVSVTHRLSTTDPCDKVIVLKNGVVGEEGPPQELLKDPASLFYEMRSGGKTG